MYQHFSVCHSCFKTFKNKLLQGTFFSPMKLFTKWNNINDWLQIEVAKLLCYKVQIVKNPKAGWSFLVSLICCMYSGTFDVLQQFYFSLNTWKKSLLDGDICSMKENLMHLVTDTFKHLNNKIVKFLNAIPWIS